MPFLGLHPLAILLIKLLNVYVPCGPLSAMEKVKNNAQQLGDKVKKEEARNNSTIIICKT